MSSTTAPAAGRPTPRPVAGEHVMTPADWVVLALPGVIWGSSFFFIAEGLESFEPALIAPARIFFGLITLLAFPAARVRMSRGDTRRSALLGMLWLAAPLSLFSFAEQHVSSSLTGMLNGATPLFVAVVATLIARHLPPRHQIVGLLVGFLGVVLIAVPSLDAGGSSAFGIGLILLALCCYGVSINLLVPLQRRNGSLPVIVRAQAAALVVTAPFGVGALPESSWSWGSALAVVALGALGTGAAYALAATNAGRLGSTRASVTTYIIPVVSLALGVAIRDETVAGLAIAGSAVALVGAYLTNRSPRPRRSPVAP